MKNSILFILVLFVFLILPFNTAQALSCHDLSIQTQIRLSSAVVVVKVDSLVGGDQNHANVTVIHSWKGPRAGQSIEVLSTSRGGYQVGKEYLLFTSGKDPYLVESCSGSRSLISQAAIDDEKNEVVKRNLTESFQRQNQLIGDTGPNSLGSYFYNSPLFTVTILHYPIIAKPLAILIILLTIGFILVRSSRNSIKNKNL